MQNNHPTYTKLAFLFILLLIGSILPISSVKAQCDISLGTLDVVDTITLSTNAGGTAIAPVTVTNISTASFDVWAQANQTPTFFFKINDSTINQLAPNSTATIHVNFHPSITANGVITGTLHITNAKTFCSRKIFLVGIVKPNLCLETEHELSYQDPVLIGTTAQHEFRLTNQSGADITITDVLLQDSIYSGFRINSQLPLVVPKNSSNTFLDYTFSPTSDFSGSFFNTTFATIDLLGDSVGCKSVTVLLIGNVAMPGGGSGIDTTLRPLFPSDTRTLSIEGTGKPTSVKFTFTDNLNVPVSINKVYLKDGSYFKVSSTNPSPVPFTLNTDQTMDVTVNYIATDNLLHTDSLLIDASHNLQTIAFALKGEQMSDDVPSELPNGVSITISPNPASSFVTIETKGIRTALIQIYDLLGREVVSSTSTSEWKWDSSHYSDGSYILRISGESVNGEHFINSKRLIISR